MVKAFVLINTDIGTENEIVERLKQIPYVKEAHIVYGVYDIIAEIEAESMDKIKETISWHIRRLDHVRSTLTMFVVES